jgi:hypothetical protein
VSDLTAEEQKNVRAALRFLRIRIGADNLAKVLHAHKATVRLVIAGRAVSASIAVRTAKLAGVSVDDVITGRFPPAGVCPHCGHQTVTRPAPERPV